MKYKNVEKKLKNVVDGFSCILDFPKLKRIIVHQLNPQNLSSTTAATAKGKQKKSRKALPHLNNLQEIYL